MKKNCLLFLSFVSIFLLSGCGKIDKALNNMSKLDSFTITFEEIDNGNESHYVYDVDVINKTVKETGSVNFSDSNKEYVSYSQYIDGKFVTYTSSIFSDDWIYDEFMVGSIDDYPFDGVLYASSCDYDDIDMILSLDSSFFKKVKSDKKGIYKYQIDLNELNDIIGFNYYVYTDGKYVTKIEMSYDNSSVSFSFSNFNNASVIIPNSVKENAKAIEYIDFSGIDLSKISDIYGIQNDFILEQYEQAKEFFD